MLPRFSPFLWAFLPPLLINAIFILQPWFDRWLIYVDPLLAAEMTENCCDRSLGLASSVGIMYWTAGAACCALAAALLRDSPSPRAKVVMLAQAALLTGYLGLDDLIMLHDSVYPRLGIPELATFGVYGVLTLGYLLTNWRIMAAEEPALFCAALGFLLLSVVVDVDGNDAHLLWKQLLEEGAKLMGIAGWAVWHTRLGYREVRGQMRGAGQ